MLRAEEILHLLAEYIEEWPFSAHGDAHCPCCRVSATSQGEVLTHKPDCRYKAAFDDMHALLLLQDAQALPRYATGIGGEVERRMKIRAQIKLAELAMMRGRQETDADSFEHTRGVVIGEPRWRPLATLESTLPREMFERRLRQAQKGGA